MYPAGGGPPPPGGAGAAGGAGAPPAFPASQEAAAGGAAGLHSPHFNTHALLDTVLDGKYKITRFLSNVTGAYGFPYQGTELATGQPVFIKVLKSARDGNSYSVHRELDAVERMINMQLQHEHLARLRCVLRSATARRVDAPDQVVMFAVPAIVSDFYSSGDLFDALFKPHSGGRLARPRAMPEPIALHYTWQLVQAVSCLHAQAHFHRDLKPENVMFDESYNVKVTDFGACVCVPVSDVLEQPRAMTGIHYDPNDQRMWRVGTEAYAPPEIFFPGSDGYDATKYDVWSLGIILFLMLCIDSLDIIQIPEMSTGSRRTTLRMPFLSYANVIYPLRGNATGACGNLTNQLDDPPSSFTGLLEQPAPTHERFWRHFPGAQERLSTSAKDLINRMLVKEPDQRIDLEDVKRHPWMQMLQSLRPSAEAIRHEMAHRAPPAREIAGDQRIICLLPNQEQWMSLGELRRSLRGGAVVPFPKDDELGTQAISCGAKGSSEYRGAWVFAALSHFLNSQGVVTQQFCKRQLRLSCCTTDAVGNLVEQFVAQVIVVREEVMILLQPGAEATEFPIWNDRVRVFVANQARLVPSEDAAVASTAAQQALHAAAAAAVTAAADPHARNVRQRMEPPQLPQPPAAWLGHSALMPVAEADVLVGMGGGAVSVGTMGPPASHGRLASSDTLMPVPSYTATDGTGQTMGQGLDWSWPPMPAEDMAMAEIAFDKQMNVPRGGWLWMGRFMDFLEVVDGVPKMEAEAVWHLVMPSGTRCMFKEQFMRARYILKGLSEGRSMPPNFPEHVYKQRIPLPRVGVRMSETFGTKEQPIRYDFFAYLVRPILEAEYRTRHVIYRKTSPVAVLCGADRSPFAPRPGGTEVERFMLMNIGSCADSWAIKESNFVENYQPLPAGELTIPDSYLTDESAADGQPLRALVCNALQRVSGEGGEASTSGGDGWAADADWAALRAKLAALRASQGPGSTWRLALPKNHVVAVRLTADVLRACFSHVGLPLDQQHSYYREETYKPNYCEFRVGDYALSDVAQVTNMTLFDRASTHDRAWVWKPLNKVMRGQTLITRTMGSGTFHATYVAVNLLTPPGGSPTVVPPSSSIALAPSMTMDRAPSARWEPPPRPA